MAQRPKARLRFHAAGSYSCFFGRPTALPSGKWAGCSLSEPTPTLYASSMAIRHAEAKNYFDLDAKSRCFSPEFRRLIPDISIQDARSGRSAQPISSLKYRYPENVIGGMNSQLRFSELYIHAKFGEAPSVSPNYWRTHLRAVCAISKLTIVL